MGGAIEIQTHLDSSEAVADVRTHPTGYRGAIEIVRQSTTEVSAVDRAGTADRGSAHDGQVTSRFIGEFSKITLDQQAANANKQLQAVSVLSQQFEIGEPRTDLEHGHSLAGTERKTLGNSRSSIASTDDQHIAVRDDRGQHGD